MAATFDTAELDQIRVARWKLDRTRLRKEKQQLRERETRGEGLSTFERIEEINREIRVISIRIHRTTGDYE